MCAWVAPSNVTTNDLITAATWNQDVVANTTYLGNNHNHKTAIGAGDGGGLKTFHCSVGNSANQSIADGVGGSDTICTFDTDIEDADAMHSVVTNTGRITVPSGGDGHYFIWACLGYAANTTGVRLFYFRKNGTVSGPMHVISNQGASLVAKTSLHWAWELAATDYIEIMTAQNSTSSLNLIGEGATIPMFGMFRFST